MKFFEKIRSVILNPTEFFDEIKKEEGVIEAFKYNLLLSIAPAIMLTIVLILFFFTISGLVYTSRVGDIAPQPTIDVGTILIIILGGALIGSYVIMAIGPFILALVYHIFVLIFKGKGGYEDTYKTLVYSSTPMMLFSCILPIIFVVFIFTRMGGLFYGISSMLFTIPLVIIYSLFYITSLYTFLLIVTGFSISHEVSMPRAFLMVTVPIMVGFILVFILILLIPTLLYGLFTPIIPLGD